MPDTAKAIQALKETRPPATDRFTYLTVVEEYLSPEILPTLNEILQDAELVQDIGWDLVEKLIPLPGSEECLETIARLGNPREVILKVLEVLETMGDSERSNDDEEEEEEEGKDDGEGEEAARTDAVVVNKFITLLGMLGILHKRIKTKYPSRFLGTSLRTVLAAYRPTQEMTASVINLVHSLSGRRRPPLPTRKSSVNVANPDQDSDPSKNAPDPEAQGEAPGEHEIQERLLLSFVTCIVEAYANANGGLEWAPRLLEYFNPDRLVPGKKTALERYREDQELSARDGIVGQLVALTRDLGLSGFSKTELQSLYKGPITRDPLVDVDEISGPGDIALSTGGSICILAYWVFSSAVFKADQPQLDLHLFPDHLAMLKLFLEDDAASRAVEIPGTVEALVALGLWLDHNQLIVAANADANFMSLHHLLTLCAVFHPSLAVRHAATTLAGRVLQADPDADDRLKILEDLLENCMFASLKACAVAWLRDEIAAGRVATPDAVEELQYAVFPDVLWLKDQDPDALLEWWVQNAPFIMQAANFAYLLLCSEKYRAVVPPDMGPAVEQRFVDPLLHAAAALGAAIASGEVKCEGMGMVSLDLEVLVDRLKRLGLS